MMLGFLYGLVSCRFMLALVSHKHHRMEMSRFCRAVLEFWTFNSIITNCKFDNEQTN